MTLTPIKPVESPIDVQDKAAALLVVAVAVDVDVVEVELDVDVGVVFVEVSERVTGKEGKDNVGCADAMLQNCCPRLSIVVTWSGQSANTQSTISAGY